LHQILIVLSSTKWKGWSTGGLPLAGPRAIRRGPRSTTGRVSISFYGGGRNIPLRRNGRPPAQCTEDHLREYLSYLREELAFRWGKPVLPGKEKLAAKTIKTYATCVRTFFNWLEDEHIIETTPFTRRLKVTTKKDPIKSRHHKNLTRDQIDLIFAKLKEPDKLKKYNGVRNLAIIALLLDSGIRRGELLSMRVKDIDMDSRRIFVNGKSGERTVFFGPVAYNAIVLYKKRWRNQQDQAADNALLALLGWHALFLQRPGHHDKPAGPRGRYHPGRPYVPAYLRLSHGR
jgi:site-specific recombinase XerD